MRGHRQDAWSKDEDILLAETVLRYIREGKTQLEAFKKVGILLSRTSAACGFRWNASLRKHYEEAIQLAKNNRKKLALVDDAKMEEKTTEIPNIPALIQSLEKLSTYYEKPEITEKLTTMKKENTELKQQLDECSQLFQEIDTILLKWKKHNKQH